jgi:hypothetical protein
MHRSDVEELNILMNEVKFLLFIALQEDNTPMVQHYTTRIADIRSELDDLEGSLMV